MIMLAWSWFTFNISEVTLDYSDAQKIWLAVFVIEKIIDEQDLDRTDVVETLQTFGQTRGLSDDPRFIALLWMIDFHHQWVMMTLHREGWDSTWKEYGWGVLFDADIQADISYNGFTCTREEALASDGRSECQTQDVMLASNIDVIEPLWLLTTPDLFMYLTDRSNMGCLEDDSVIIKPRRSLWNGAYVHHVRELTLSKGDSHLIAQYLPFIEQNYGSPGPAGFACQSVFHRIEKG